jgi:hypothetical protein
MTRWMRLAGRDAPAQELLANAAGRALPVAWPPTVPGTPEDDTLLDPNLTRADEPSVEAPPSDASYAAFSPGQRTAFWQWLAMAHVPAPTAFVHLLLAQLEIRLFDLPQRAELVTDLNWLHENNAWPQHDALTRVLLLQQWLAQDAAGLVHWSLATERLSADLWNVLLGWQAMLGLPLQQAQMAPLARAWKLATPPRLTTLRELLDAEPLAHALAAANPAEREPKPWRGIHRAVRLMIPQPSLRPLLLPLLKEQTDISAAPEPLQEQAPTEAASERAPQIEEEGWHLILEFGQSRSDYFHAAVALAERSATFTKLVDENRNVVYRVMYKKDKMRNFWRLWNLVESWSSTRIYVRGEELEKWKVWRYSQFLQ